jgi:hypothetical protein
MEISLSGAARDIESLVCTENNGTYNPQRAAIFQSLHIQRSNFTKSWAVERLWKHYGTVPPTEQIALNKSIMIGTHNESGAVEHTFRYAG